MRGQARRRVCAVLHEATNDETVVVVKRIGGGVRVVLLFIITPTMVTKLMTEILRHRCCSVKGRLPIYFLTIGW